MLTVFLLMLTRTIQPSLYLLLSCFRNVERTEKTGFISFLNKVFSLDKFLIKAFPLIWPTLLLLFILSCLEKKNTLNQRKKEPHVNKCLFAFQNNTIKTDGLMDLFLLSILHKNLKSDRLYLN